MYSLDAIFASHDKQLPFRVREPLEDPIICLVEGEIWSFLFVVFRFFRKIFPMGPSLAPQGSDEGKFLINPFRECNTC
jgi:hypothetical protein